MTQDNLLDPNSNSTQDYFAEYTREGGKFYDPDPEKAKQKIAKAKWDSDQYIKTLEQKQDELRADYLKLRDENVSGARMQELIDRLDALQKQPRSDNTSTANENTKPSITPDELRKLAREEVLSLREQDTATANYKFVQAKLQERLGPNYQEALKNQIDTLGLTPEYVNQMARQYPQALLRTLGVADAAPQNTSFQSIPKGTTSSNAFAPAVQKRTWQYYQNMKKSEPAKYHSSETNVQMHNDMIALGDEFKDGDFGRYGD